MIALVCVVSQALLQPLSQFLLWFLLYSDSLTSFRFGRRTEETRLGAGPPALACSVWAAPQSDHSISAVGPLCDFHPPPSPHRTLSLPPSPTTPSFPWIRARLLINVIYIPSRARGSCFLKTQAAPGHISQGVHMTPGAPEGQMHKPRV